MALVLMESLILTSILCSLITEDLVWRALGIGMDQVHLGVFSSSTVDVLTLLTWSHRKLKKTKNKLWYNTAAERGYVFANSINTVTLTGYHRDWTLGGAWLLAVLPLGLDGLFQLLDLQPDLVQDALQPHHIIHSTWCPTQYLILYLL